jgi:Na+/serine symporter
MGVADSKGKFFFLGSLIQKISACNVLGVITTFKLGVASSKIDLRVKIWGSLGVAHLKTDPRVTIWRLLASFFFTHKGGVTDPKIDPRVIK